MGEHGGFLNNSRHDVDHANQRENAENALRQESFKTSENTENKLESKLQALSPDKPVICATDLNKLSPEQFGLLRDCLKDTARTVEMADQSIKNRYNKNKLEEMNGGENADKGELSKYMQKMIEVLNANMNDSYAALPFRVAFGIQSFNPGRDGQMKAETLYAFYPPTQPAGLHERYITFALHSPDPSREAQIRRDPSMGYAMSNHEFDFNCKKYEANGVPLLERRTKADVA
ncbi:MAG: hypothetical protein K2X81_05185 [Candidatus Obscuribacterales bacterium]|nr:hypothetical protein [Candidatus Obscuribacterales bacterium]